MKKLIDTDVAQEMFDRIKRASQSVEGTHECRKYDMQQDFKSCSGAWKFCGWGIPIFDATKVVTTIKTWKDKTYLIVESVGIKTWKDKTYFIVESVGMADRYTLTYEVKKLIEDLI